MIQEYTKAHLCLHSFHVKIEHDIGNVWGFRQTKPKSSNILEASHNGTTCKHDEHDHTTAHEKRSERLDSRGGRLIWPSLGDLPFWTLDSPPCWYFSLHVSVLKLACTYKFVIIQLRRSLNLNQTCMKMNLMETNFELNFLKIDLHKLYSQHINLLLVRTLSFLTHFN